MRAETHATSIAGQDPKNYCNDHSVTVVEIATMSNLSNSSSESRPVDGRINLPVITIRNSEIDVNKGSSDSDIDETLTKPAVKECFENYDDEQMNKVPQQQPE